MPPDYTETKETTMRFWTSYFGNVRNLPSDIVPIGIAGKSPGGWKGLEYKSLPLPGTSIARGNTSTMTTVCIRQDSKQNVSVSCVSRMS